MLSLFYKALEIRTLKGSHLTIFKPNSGQQVVLIKGKLGQYKFGWSCTTPLAKAEEKEGQPASNTGPKIKSPTIKIFGAATPLEQVNFIGSPEDSIGEQVSVSDAEKEQRKLFVFNKKTKKMVDSVLLSSARISEKSLNDEINNFKVLFPESYRATSQNGETEGAKDGQVTDKIYIGEFTEPNISTKSQKEGTNEINFNFVLSLAGKFKDKLNIRKGEIISEHIKNMMIGVTQGFTVSLELEGIGYQAKIENLNEEAIAKIKEKTGKTQNPTNLLNIPHYNGGFKYGIWASEEKGESKATKGIKETIYKALKKNVRDKSIIKKGQADRKDKRTYGQLALALGQSHKLVYPLYTKDVTASVIRTDPVTVSLFGISRSVVNQVAAEIYLYKKPEPYKGKGIRYNGEKFFAKKKNDKAKKS